MTEEKYRSDTEEKRGRPNISEETVLRAWKRGERTISEIMEITGLSRATVRRYIPINKNG